MKRFILMSGLVGLSIGSISHAAIDTPALFVTSTYPAASSTASSTIANGVVNPNFPDWPPVLAGSAIVYDPISGTVLYEKNADVKRPMASLVKIMTAVVADDILKNYPSVVRKPITIKNATSENVADFDLKKGST